MEHNQENTIILSLKLKLEKDKYIFFNLRKYDDLFETLKNFVELNNIKKELIKPLSEKIVESLNKISSLLNNKISIYDREYLNSLNKLWIKNKEQPIKNINDRQQSSFISSKEYIYKDDIKNNSFQNGDENSDNESIESVHSI